MRCTTHTSGFKSKHTTEREVMSLPLNKVGVTNSFHCILSQQLFVLMSSCSTCAWPPNACGENGFKVVGKPTKARVCIPNKQTWYFDGVFCAFWKGKNNDWKIAKLVQVTNMLITNIVWDNIVVDTSIKLTYNFFNRFGKEVLVPLLDEVFLNEILKTSKDNFVCIFTTSRTRC